MTIALVGEAVRVPLVGGTFYTLVSAEDLEKVLQYSWRIKPGKHTNYAQATIKNRSVFLHRFILDIKDHHWVDHIDRDGLNNQRNNIRIVSPSVNSHRAEYPTGVTGLRGVYTHRNKYAARCKIEAKRFYLGSFDTALEAHNAYINFRRKMGLEDVNSLSR